jgi:integrase
VLAELRDRPVSRRFSRATTVVELTSWWLESVARHQVKRSTLDSYRKFTGYLVDDLGARRVVDVGAETLTEWQSKLLDRFAPFTVLNCRKVCRQAFTEAVKVGLIPANPFDLVKAPRGRRVSPGRALSPDDARRLIAAAAQIRLGAAVTLLFCQGWRVSEVLGLAWEDLDLSAGTAHIRRAAAYTPSAGVTLGTTKTPGAQGIHHLAPVAVAALRRRREEQLLDQALLDDAWGEHRYDGEIISPVFTTAVGGLVNRQAVVKAIERAAVLAGLDPAGLATHAGRRTVITALYADGGVDLADVARHVGHTNTATTAGYVRNLGKRPETTARRAAELLDPSIPRT